MILFVGHDPGAKNNLLPLFRNARGLGVPASFWDLSEAGKRREGDEITSFYLERQVQCLVCGFSTNHEEWPWAKQAGRMGIKTAIFFDVGVGLTPFGPADGPDRILVANSACVGELKKLGFPEGAIHVTGSPHLEGLSVRPVPNIGTPAVRQHYGVMADQALLSLFFPADETSPEAWTGMTSGALVALHALLSRSSLGPWTLIVRAHPRSSGKQIALLAEMCRELNNVRFDSPNAVETPALLAASLFSLSLASTVSLESLVLGVPSAFFQIGWNYRALDGLYANVDCVPRLRSPRAFDAFVSRIVADPDRMTTPLNRQDYQDATRRAWNVIAELTQDRDTPGSNHLTFVNA